MAQDLETNYKYQKFQCNYCQQNTVNCCSACQTVFYCTYQHQVNDWPVHKDFCPKLRLASKINQQNQLALHRENLRRQLITGMYNKTLQQNLIDTNKVIKFSKQIYQIVYSKQQYLEYLLDILYQCKVFLFHQNVIGAVKQAKLLLKQLPEIPISKLGDPIQKQQKEYIRKYLDVVAMVLGFLDMGKQDSWTKQLWEKYIQGVQYAYGINSIPMSNTLFTASLWYKNIQQFIFALLLIKKSHQIRLRILGEWHEATTDCLLNMALLHKQLGESQESIPLLYKCLIYRKKSNGSRSLPVAHIFQQIGKIYLQNGEYKQAFQNIKQCLQIRKNILKTSDPQINRVFKLVTILHQKEGGEMMDSSKVQSYYSRVSNQRQQNSALSGNVFFEDTNYKKVQQEQGRQKENQKDIGIDVSKQIFQSLNPQQIQHYQQLKTLLRSKKPINKPQLVLNSQFFQSLSITQQQLFKKINNIIND